MIQLSTEILTQLGPDQARERYGGTPIVLHRPTTVVALYLAPHGVLHEHAAPEPILFLVTAGGGHMRVGGPQGDDGEVVAGDAVLWPANVLHGVWTDEAPLHAIVVHYGPGKDEHETLGA
jgi:quercetin dioxygenase-like cupin family protein